MKFLMRNNLFLQFLFFPNSLIFVQKCSFQNKLYIKYREISNLNYFTRK